MLEFKRCDCNSCLSYLIKNRPFVVERNGKMITDSYTKRDILRIGRYVSKKLSGETANYSGVRHDITITSGELKIGCETFSWPEVRRFLKKMGINLPLKKDWGRKKGSL